MKLLFGEKKMDKIYWIEIHGVLDIDEGKSSYRTKSFPSIEEAQSYWRENKANELTHFVELHPNVKEITDISIYQQITTRVYPLI